MKKIFIILFSFLLVMLSSACTKNTPTNQDTTTPATTEAVDSEIELYKQYADIVEDDENIYYFDGKSIIKQNRKTNKKTTLKKEDEFIKPCLDGEWLYYAVCNDEIYSAYDRLNYYRLKTDGSEYEFLFTDTDFIEREDETLTTLKVIDGFIYINMNFPLYRYNIESKEFVRLSDDVERYHILKDKLYYIDHANSTFTIYEMDLNTGEIKILLGDGKTAYHSNDEGHDPDKEYYKNFIFIGEEMFYYRRGNVRGLYRYANGKKILIDNDKNIDDYELIEYEDKLYYFADNATETNVGDKAELKCYDLKTKEVSTVLELDHNPNYASIKKGYLFYTDITDDTKHCIKLPE